MSEKIIRNKIAREAERRARDSLRTSLTPELERAISKSFLELFDLEVSAHFTQKTLNSPKEILVSLETTLFNVMGMHVGAGLICADRRFVNSVVRGLVGVKIDPAQELSDRETTPTDVALCSHFLKKSMTGIFAKLGETGKEIGFLDHETEKAPLAFILNAPRYAFLRMIITNDDGGQFGQLEFVLPIPCLEVFAQPNDHSESADERAKWRQAFDEISQTTPLEFSSVIARTNVPLSELMDMAPGNIIELGSGSLQNLLLEANTNDGVAEFYRGQLGALSQYKAFKVSDVRIDKT